MGEGRVNWIRAYRESVVGGRSLVVGGGGMIWMEE